MCQFFSVPAIRYEHARLTTSSSLRATTASRGAGLTFTTRDCRRSTSDRRHHTRTTNDGATKTTDERATVLLARGCSCCGKAIELTVEPRRIIGIEYHSGSDRRALLIGEPSQRRLLRDLTASATITICSIVIIVPGVMLSQVSIVGIAHSTERQRKSASTRVGVATVAAETCRATDHSADCACACVCLCVCVGVCVCVRVRVESVCKEVSLRR